MHRRSHSSASDHQRRFTFTSDDLPSLPPIPPPRSAPATVRKRRRDVGDRVFITSPTTVYLEFLDENLLVCERRGYFQFNEEEEIIDSKIKCCDSYYENDCDDRAKRRHAWGFAKFRSKIVLDGQELQEINAYIGKGRKSNLLCPFLPFGIYSHKKFAQEFVKRGVLILTMIPMLGWLGRWLKKYPDTA